MYPASCYMMLGWVDDDTHCLVQRKGQMVSLTLLHLLVVEDVVPSLQKCPVVVVVVVGWLGGRAGDDDGVVAQ